MRREDTLRLALAALVAHKLRTTLTILGLAMGVTFVILVMTLIQGADWYVETKVANLGTDVFQVSKVPLATTDFEELLRALRFRDITIEDMRAVAAACRRCEAVGAVVETAGRVRTGNESLTDVSIRGQTANMGAISTLDIAEGRFFFEGEQRLAAHVAVVGSGIVEKLFAGRSPIGRTLRVGGEEFLIIGVVERIGSVLGQEQDNFVIIPLDVFTKLFGARHSLVLNVLAPGGDAVRDAAMDEVRLVLRARRHLGPGDREDFYFTTAETYLDLWRDLSDVFFLVFVLVSTVAAVVGGIVIMNITLVSVTERTKEIGLRRSVGARQRDIARQFLAEVLAQCLAGGAAGVASGITLAWLLRQLTPFPTVVEPWVAVLGLGLASGIALAFGFYPALKAARLDPIVALRTE
jgi:putative ABC transport system permease protein